MCVRNVDDQGVLQFTLILAAGCVLHRRTSRVIHRQELCHNSWKIFPSSAEHQENHQKKKAPTGERRPSMWHAEGKFPLPPHSTGPSLQALRRDAPHWRRAVVGRLGPPSLGPGARPGTASRGRVPGRPARMALPKLTCSPVHGGCLPDSPGSPAKRGRDRGPTWHVVCLLLGNDPSAGSPTETLLRLLLPLNDQV